MTSLSWSCRWRLREKAWRTQSLGLADPNLLRSGSVSDNSILSFEATRRKYRGGTATTAQCIGSRTGVGGESVTRVARCAVDRIFVQSEPAARCRLRRLMRVCNEESM